MPVCLRSALYGVSDLMVTPVEKFPRILIRPLYVPGFTKIVELSRALSSAFVIVAHGFGSVPSPVLSSPVVAT